MDILGSRDLPGTLGTLWPPMTPLSSNSVRLVRYPDPYLKPLWPDSCYTNREVLTLIRSYIVNKMGSVGQAAAIILDLLN